jgi:hypothetical protein
MATRVLCIALVLAAAVTSSAFSGTNDRWIVRPDSFGPVKIGMTLEQVNAVLHENFSVPEHNEDQGCFYVAPKMHPHVAFMIENGRLVRIDVDTPDVPTPEGVQVGDSEQRAKNVYGTRLKIEPHAYTSDEGGHYLTVRSQDGRYGTRFETDGKKIESYYAGRFSAIQYIEGCE